MTPETETTVKPAPTAAAHASKKAKLKKMLATNMAKDKQAKSA